VLLYEISAFVLMKTAANFSFLKIYRKGAESVLQLLLLNLSVTGGIILKWIFKSGMRRHELDCCSSRQGQVAVACECGNEPSGTIKWWDFSD